MLDFGFSEVLLTSVIALVVLGPERLPEVARQVGNWMGRARVMARQLSEQLDREVAAADVTKEIAKARSAVDSLTTIDPLAAASRDPTSTPNPASAVDHAAPAVTPADTPKSEHE